MKQTTCNSVRQYYFDYIQGSLEELPQWAISHISTCEKCKAEIDEFSTEINKGEPRDVALRGQLLLLHLRLDFSFLNKEVTCEDAAGFIPSIIGLGINTAMRTPINHHMTNCKSCLDKLKQLSKMQLSTKDISVLGRLLAENSLTITDIQRETSIQGTLSLEILELFAKDGETITILNSKDNSNNGKNHSSSKLFRRIQYAAAAILLVLSMTIFFSKTAIGLNNVHEKIADIPYLHITDFGSENEILQERWISSPDNTYIIMNDTKLNIIDLKSGIKSDYLPDSQNTEAKTYKIKVIPQSPWSLLPSDSPAELPLGAEWSIIKTENGLTAYHLNWSILDSAGNTLAKRIICTMKGENNPTLIQWQHKSKYDKDYITLSSSKIERLTKEEFAEFKTKIKSRFPYIF